MKIKPKGLAFLATLAGFVALGARRSEGSTPYDDNVTGLSPYTPPSPVATPTPPATSPGYNNNPAVSPYAQPQPSPSMGDWWGYVVLLPDGRTIVWSQTVPPPGGTQRLYKWGSGGDT